MVLPVTRKTAANLSRTPSQQTQPKAKQKHQKQKQKTPPPATNTRNNLPRLLDRLFLLSLSLFTIYALLICRLSPPPSSPSPPPLTCRVLSTYRTTILEPYLIPPLRFVFTHPTIKSTYSTHLKPHIDTAQQISQPLINTAVKLDDTIRPPITRFYKRTLEPCYFNAFLPRYRLYVLPYVRKAVDPLRPYFLLVNQKCTFIQHRVHKLNHKVQILYFTHLHPYYRSITRHSLSLWIKTKPILSTAYTQTHTHLVWVWNSYLKPILRKGWEGGKGYISKGWKEVINKRQTYVDPHIRKILERVFSPSPEHVVDEHIHQSTTTPTPTFIPVHSPTPTQNPSLQTDQSHFIPPIPQTLDTPYPSSHSPLLASTTKGALDEHPTPRNTSVGNEAIGDAQRAMSVVDESVVGYQSTPTSTDGMVEESGPARELERELRESGWMSGSDAAMTTDDASTLKIVVDETGTVDPTTAPGGGVNTQPLDKEEEDVDDFLADLGVDDSSSPSSLSLSPATISPTPTSLSPSELASLSSSSLAAVASKRAWIVNRHEDWQNQLNEMVKEQSRRVSEELRALRVGAVAELGEGKREGEEGLGKRVLSGVQREGERLIKGLEAYLRKAEGRKGEWVGEGGEKAEEGGGDKSKGDERKNKLKEEKDKWNQVIDKVEERFKNVVRGVEGDVYEWYTSVKGREGDVILEASNAIKILAERAQADIGLDYAWLDDVTYQDWQRYHDLMRTSENFAETALSIQNGTFTNDHPSSTIEPLTDLLILALDILQRDLDDVVSGFHVLLGGVRGRGRDVFSSGFGGGSGSGSEEKEEDDDDDDDDSDGVDGGVGGMENVVENVVGGLGLLKDQTEDLENDQEDKGEEEQQRQQQRVDPLKVVIGKDKVTVESALKDVPVVQREHEEL